MHKIEGVGMTPMTVAAAMAMAEAVAEAEAVARHGERWRRMVGWTAGHRTLPRDHHLYQELVQRR